MPINRKRKQSSDNEAASEHKRDLHELLNTGIVKSGTTVLDSTLLSIETENMQGSYSTPIHVNLFYNKSYSYTVRKFLADLAVCDL